MTVIVVGAGIAGLACARELVDAGVPARVLERGRVVGGRLASKRFDDRYADIGAAYLTADDPAFPGRLESWRIDGLAHPWTDTFAVYDGRGITRPAARCAGRRRAACAAWPRIWPQELDVTLGARGHRPLPEAEAVVLAMPGPQAQRIAALDMPRRHGHRCWPRC